MTAKKRRPRRVASLVIVSPGKMTPQVRRDVAEWMFEEADRLVKDGRNYTTRRFTAGFNYEPP